MTERIGSWAEGRARAAGIVERLNVQRPLALAAAANPMLAIEHLGYAFEAEARHVIADRLRLAPTTADGSPGVAMR
ncbi:hypothetical protein GCM10010383_28810 [Streptomyces lomondensis]|uniref:Uncharacterized protein n=1 Tax=Streptomyces lomondensis TaxID=68229 RepID=A0ABQ2X3C7_9ACTN|nr:hypothetical protein GCM10010383_28810 [Streptomyces lomondensis]